MNKLMFAAVAALCATVAVADGSETLSTGIVGYQTFTLNSQYTLFGLGFDSVQGGGMTLNEAFPYKEGSGMTADYTDTLADNLQVMGSDGVYKYYFLSDGRWGKNGKNFNADFVGKWVKDANVECNDMIVPGQAVWYVSKKAKETPHDITIAGAVVAGTLDSKTCTSTYTLFGNPYPMDIPINGSIITDNATMEYTDTLADNLQVMGTDGVYKYYFLSDGRWGKNGKNLNPDFVGKWVKDANVECNDTIPAGKAFWYVSKNKNTTVTIKSPFEKAE